MSPHAAQFTEALQAFQAMTAWWGGWLPVRLGSWRGQREVIWRRGPSSDLPELVRWLDESHDDEIMLGIPQERPFNGGVHRASVLWVRVEGNDQVRRARAFKPRPSLVLREGSSSRRWLFWALEETVDYFRLQDANRKLAYALRATQKHGDPDAVWFPAPGTCLRRDRSRPCPVVVGRLTLETFRAESVVGRLKEPPPRDAWMDVQAVRG